MKQIDFHRAIKQHCIQAGDCTKCCLRLYCYTPPCERTDSMMQKVIDFFEADNLNSRKECHNHSDHYIGVRQMECPCNVDMSTAIGYEHR